MSRCIAWGENVYKRFGEMVVFEGASFCFKKGFNVLWAPNGAGKTTLIKMLLGVLRPDKGVLGIDRSGGIGVLMEDTHIPSETLVSDAMEYSYLAKGVSPDLKEAIGILEEIGVGRMVLKREFGELSAGTKKKILLAQALTGKPKLLVLDEPLATLDPSSRIKVSLFLNKVSEENVSLIVSTHILSLLKPHSLYTISEAKIKGGYKVGLLRRPIAINPETGEEKAVTVEEAIKLYQEGYVILDA